MAPNQQSSLLFRVWDFPCCSRDFFFPRNFSRFFFPLTFFPQQFFPEFCFLTSTRSTTDPSCESKRRPPPRKVSTFLCGGRPQSFTFIPLCQQRLREVTPRLPLVRHFRGGVRALNNFWNSKNQTAESRVASKLVEAPEGHTICSKAQTLLRVPFVLIVLFLFDLIVVFSKQQPGNIESAVYCTHCVAEMETRFTSKLED